MPFGYVHNYGVIITQARLMVWVTGESQNVSTKVLSTFPHTQQRQVILVYTLIKENFMHGCSFIQGL